MGYSTQSGCLPSKATIKSHIQSTTTAMFYELAHGGYNYFAHDCWYTTTASDISTWMGGGGSGGPARRKATYTKMPFAFIGSCGGMALMGSGSLSHAFRKGSTERTTTVGLWFYDYYGGAYHAKSCMDNAWSNELNWQGRMFSYMKSGYSVKSAFDKATADYPMCNGCMRFAGDPNFAVVPVVTRVPLNQPPTASISANPTSGKAPLKVSFTGSGKDSDGTIASYKWNFGDGSKGGGPAGRPDDDGGGDGGGGDAQTTHTYNNPGTYKATLTVTDDDGATGSASVIITVTGSGGGGGLPPLQPRLLLTTAVAMFQGRQLIIIPGLTGLQSTRTDPRSG